MAEYITKDEIIDWIWKQKRLSKPYTVSVISNNMPPADVAPVVHGEWIEGKELERCSICGKKGFPDWPYCPKCGAKMDGGKAK